MPTERRPRPHHAVAVGAVLLVGLALAGCGDGEPEASHDEPESWSVTAWGERYEIFPETAALSAGEVATSHVHVTALDGFRPVEDGAVEVVLSGAGGEQVFRADEAARPGIFAVDVQPGAAGDYDLAFRIDGPAGPEEIPGGRVRVDEAGTPGRLLRAPAPRGAADGGEPLPFLKEEQWRSDFATAWVRHGSLASSIEGLARVLPPAGGEATLSAPVGAVVRSSRWPYPGLDVRRGEALFRLLPRLAAESSLAQLEAQRTAAASELTTATARRARLEELLALEAVSRRDVEEARSRVEILTGRLAAAETDLEATRAAREGGAGAGGHRVRAPFDGQVAAVLVSPGAVVAAGEPLARVVRTDRRWLRVAVAPEATARLADGVAGAVVSFREGDALRLDGPVELVSVAPETDPATGTVAVILEVEPQPRLVLGTTVQAQVLLERGEEGVVIPASALVDDGGVPVVYLQLSGERFARQEVHVRQRQGDRLLVAGLTPGQRLVTRGGEAVRRSSLMAGGQSHGHVH